jgi:cytochrome c oxidase subunit 4
MTSQTHGDDSTHDYGHEHQSHIQLYLMVTVGLLVLTACSYATYTPVWTSVMGESVAIKRIWMMGVSCTKAMLVITFFMHLKWEANWKWVLTIPASMMSIFLVLALVPDVGLRMRHASRERLEYSAATQAPEHGEQEAETHDSGH